MPAEDSTQPAAPGSPPVVPVPVSAVVPAPAPAPGPGAGLTAAEEAQLAKLQAKAASAVASGAKVHMRITSEHSSMTFGGFTLTPDFRPVPPHLAGPMTTAADDAGVTIEQKED